LASRGGGDARELKEVVPQGEAGKVTRARRGISENLICGKKRGRGLSKERKGSEGRGTGRQRRKEGGLRGGRDRKVSTKKVKVRGKGF